MEPVIICPKCGQDHAAVHRCQGSVWGKLPKDPAKQSKAANARWTKWRHDRALAYHKRQEQEQFPTAAPVPGARARDQKDMEMVILG